MIPIFCCRMCRWLPLIDDRWFIIHISIKNGRTPSLFYCFMERIYRSHAYSLPTAITCYYYHPGIWPIATGSLQYQQMLLPEDNTKWNRRKGICRKKETATAQCQRTGQMKNSSHRNRLREPFATWFMHGGYMLAAIIIIQVFATRGDLRRKTLLLRFAQIQRWTLYSTCDDWKNSNCFFYDFHSYDV